MKEYLPKSIRQISYKAVLVISLLVANNVLHADNSALSPEQITQLKTLLASQPQVLAQAQQTLEQNPSTVSESNAPAQPTASATAPQTDSQVPASGPGSSQGGTTGTNSTVSTDLSTGASLNAWIPQNETEKNTQIQAFRGVANQAFPLTPEQIKMLNSMLDATQQAQAAAPNDKPPEPTSTSLFVNLDPGATPPVIRLSKGFVSSLVFVDSTGAPWPIESYDLGNPSNFNIQWDKKSNTLMVQSLAAYTYGNLAVKLVNMNTPVMLTLVPGQQQVDYRVDLRVQGIGPNAQPGIQGTGLPEQADNELLNILDGIAPKGAKKLRVSGGIAEAWEVNSNLFVRSRFTLISPAWIGKMSSADGMNAYKLQPTPLLLVSRYGKVMQLKVEGI